MNNETATAVKESIQAWVTANDGPELEWFDHNHLNLREGSISTYAEGWYPDGNYGMLAVSEAISDGTITLPANIYHESYSHVELYFYED